MRTIRTAAAVVVIAILVAGCGGDDSTSTTRASTASTSTSTGVTGTSGAEGASALGTFDAAVSDLEKAGFNVVGPGEEGDFSGEEAVATLEAEKDGATFTAAEFATPEEAKKGASFFLSFEKKNPEASPAELDGTLLVYATKCCVDQGPPPVVPSEDFSAFKDAVSE